MSKSDESKAEKARYDKERRKKTREDCDSEDAVVSQHAKDIRKKDRDRKRPKDDNIYESFDNSSLSEKDIFHFLTGNPHSFLNIPEGVPILISKDLQQICNDTVSGFGIPNLQFEQSLNRIIQNCLQRKDIFYDRLEKMVGKSWSLRNLPSEDWEIYNEYYGKFYKLIDFDDIIQENFRFLQILHRDYNITHDEYMNFVLKSFYTHGLYVPFNTPDEIIKCSQQRLSPDEGVSIVADK